MPMEIRIRGVSEDVYARLSTKAALREKSLEDYLHEELQRIALPLSGSEWVKEVRKAKEREPVHVPSEVILQALHEDRK